jgi:hypothetical protein
MWFEQKMKKKSRSVIMFISHFSMLVEHAIKAKQQFLSPPNEARTKDKSRRKKLLQGWPNVHLPNVFYL